MEADERGFFGDFGGAFVPELLRPNVDELTDEGLKLLADDGFQHELSKLLREFVGRPTPLSFAANLSRDLDSEIYLKREDLCHTGSHKLNNALGQLLIAQRLGKRRVIAETGAGQHGVAVATACALRQIPCRIFMGEIDMARQALNVSRMRMLGAEIVAVTSGSRTLKDATNEALRHWIERAADTHYVLGSAVGPHPFPTLVAQLQRVIGDEIAAQLSARGKNQPDMVVACVGGGSNAIGSFTAFLSRPSVALVGVEAAGKGLDTEHTAATIAQGRPGVFHGSRSYVMQSPDGQILEAHSISAGLDYPGIGPQHAYLHHQGRVRYVAVTDEEALIAARQLAQREGIIPALESAHAVAYVMRECRNSGVVVITVSGRGDKDMEVYARSAAC